MRLRPSRAASLALALSLTPLTAARAVGAAAQGDPETGGAAFLLLPVGARATALGQAGIADAGSSEAVFWNPAGLATLAHTEFAAHFSSTFASKNTAATIHFVDRRLGTLGITGYLVDYGSQEVIPPGGELAGGRVSPKNIELLASYATDLGALALGVSYKLVQFRQDCQGNCGALRSVSGTTHGLDFGAQLGLGPADVLRIGLAVRHAGFRLQLENRDQADPMPTRLALGIAYRLPWPTRSGPMPVAARVLIDFQDEWGEYGSPDARVGLELGYEELLQVRAGYAFLQSESGGASLGIGIKVERVVIDLARVFQDEGAFDDPIHISLRILL
jgi:hypothetical protein